MKRKMVLIGMKNPELTDKIQLRISVMIASVYKGQYAPNRVISVIYCVILNRRTSSTPQSSAL